MNRFEAGLKTAESAAIRSLDMSMFTLDDIAQVTLQRPEVLQDIRGHAEAIRAWHRGDLAPLRHLAQCHGLDLVARALGFVFMEYHALRPRLRELAPRRIANIGYGFGLFDLFVHADTGAEIVLIDSGRRPAVQFDGDQPLANGSSNPRLALRFLLANGCDPRKVAAFPAEDPAIAGLRDVDLAVSLLGCGFAFPCEAFHDFFAQSVRPGGHVILDVRTRHAHEILPGLAGLGALRRLGHASDGRAIRMELTTRRTGAARAA